MRPLIIDDDSISCIILNAHLNKIYKRGSVVDTVKDAVKMCAGGDIDIVFLDIYLNLGENGSDFLKKRQEMPNLRIIPVVILSSEKDVKIITQFYKEGANSFLIKPVQDNLLREQLEMFGII